MAKPIVTIDRSGPSGNVYVVVGLCCKALSEEGKDKQAKELKKLAFEQRSYEAVLELCRKYVDLRETQQF